MGFECAEETRNSFCLHPRPAESSSDAWRSPSQGSLHRGHCTDGDHNEPLGLWRVAARFCATSPSSHESTVACHLRERDDTDQRVVKQDKSTLSSGDDTCMTTRGI